MNFYMNFYEHMDLSLKKSIPKRSLRRHYIAVKKNKFKKVLKRRDKFVEGDPMYMKYVTEDRIASYVTTPCNCSDSCCCNPRHNLYNSGLNRLTKQERIDLYRVKD